MGEYIVYKHTSPIGKCYIGLTSQGMERRANSGKGYRGSSVFYKAIQKYGWDNFTHEVLESGLSFDEACQKEREYIRRFRSLSTENGYNLEDGGSSGHRMSEESRKKLSIYRSGRKMPPPREETRLKLSQSLRGRSFSEEHRKNISLSKTGTQSGGKNPRARKVRCVESDAVFDTVKEAATFVGGSPKNIIHACAGRIKTSGGYHWMYVEV